MRRRDFLKSLGLAVPVIGLTGAKRAAPIDEVLPGYLDKQTEFPINLDKEESYQDLLDEIEGNPPGFKKPPSIVDYFNSIEWSMVLDKRLRHDLEFVIASPGCEIVNLYRTPVSKVAKVKIGVCPSGVVKTPVMINMYHCSWSISTCLEADVFDGRIGPEVLLDMYAAPAVETLANKLNSWKGVVSSPIHELPPANSGIQMKNNTGGRIHTRSYCVFNASKQETDFGLMINVGELPFSF